MLNPDFRDMLSCLSTDHVEFLVVGAYALAAHGYPRATGDIDIWIHATPDNAGRVRSSLVRFGAPDAGITVEDLLRTDTVIQLGIEPSRIDLLTGIDGVLFSDAWPHRVVVDVDGLSVPVLGKADLLTNKLAAHRDKDLSDIAWLRRHLDG
ncbi:MAG: hypothetical protein H0W83_14450 [Planctomycetes bacterium]|nr:hypothetical protein [Planctomycetota bacterium]